MTSNRFLALMQREWLQHRFGWALTVGIPLLLAVLLLGVGQIQIDDDTLQKAGDALPAMLAAVSIVATTGVMFVIAAISSLIIVSGLARRDHGDRSVEFWLSLPVGHSQSFAAPLLVHLLLVPAAALLIGLAGGYVISFVLVSRVAGAASWASLPWGDIVMASVAMTLRLLAGLPMLLLWISPLVMVVVLAGAWFKRWAWVVLGVGLGIGSLLLKKVFGAPLLAQALETWTNRGVHSLVHGGRSMVVPGANQGFEALREVPAWAFNDFTLALRELASPWLLLGLLIAAGSFVLLVQWRQRGAGAAS